MSPRNRRVVSVARDLVTPLALAGAVFAVAAAARGGLLDALGNNPTFSFTLAGSLAMHFATRPGKFELVGTSLLGLLLRMAFGATVGFKPYWGSLFISYAGFAGLASLLVLAVGALRKRHFVPLATAAFFPFSAVLVGFFVPTTARVSLMIYDANLLAVDSAFGFQPSFFLGQMISGESLLRDLTETVYYALPLGVALCCTAGRTDRARLRLLLMFASMTVVGYLLYPVCPGIGPNYAFHNRFPFSPPVGDEIRLAAISDPVAPRNAMPSLHVAAALLVFWNRAAWRRAARLACAAFLLWTMFSTMALGEHYLIDLVPAVPLTLIFYAAFSGPSPTTAGSWRLYAMLSGAALTAGWLLTLRFWVQPLLAWPGSVAILSLATVGVSVWMQRQVSALTEEQVAS